MRITYVADDQVLINRQHTSRLVATDLPAAQGVALLRQLHADEGWRPELTYPNYAALHYAGLAAIERLAAGTNTYELVPVQHGVYVVT